MNTGVTKIMNRMQDKLEIELKSIKRIELKPLHHRYKNKVVKTEWFLEYISIDNSVQRQFLQDMTYEDATQKLLLLNKMFAVKVSL